mmetsp:Transcript_32168/g.84964  ORF Transcript_32168/g.84964 Transcript_32168/m.84964 type:complete len:322 (+) Transcript_32168:109-1074(+)
MACILRRASCGVLLDGVMEAAVAPAAACRNWLRQLLGDTEAAAPAEREHYEPDPLELMTRQHPVEVMKFVQAVMVLGVFSGVGCTIACAMFLPGSWEQCWKCARPMHIWTIGHSAMQLLQVPVRVAMASRLRRTHLRGGSAAELQECVRILTQSPAWKLSKGVSMLIYGWFVVGTVWLMNSDFCRPCPGLYVLSLAVMVAAVARVFVTMAVWRHYVPQHALPEPAPKSNGVKGAVIQALPLVEYCQERFGDEGETACAVCLCVFERGETLRQLPCGHKFHCGCIDKWLSKSKKCPLCVHDVEVPLPENLERRLAFKKVKTF